MRLKDLLPVLDGDSRFGIGDRDGFVLEEGEYKLTDYVICIDAHAWGGCDAYIYLDR